MAENVNATAENTNERVDPIILEYADGKSYTLEFNRATVSFAERQGFPLTPFNAQEIMSSRPAEVISDLFYYAFQMHHKGINRAFTDRILHEDLGGLTSEWLERLIALHTLGYETLINVEDKPKNANLTVKL